MAVIKSINTKVLPVITVMLAGLVTLSPFAIDSYLAAMPVMSEFFGVSISVVELTITSYFLGFAIGNFIGGPLSDSFGRKPVALTGVALYAVASIIIPYCSNVEEIIALRVIQAFGGGFCHRNRQCFYQRLVFWETGCKITDYSEYDDDVGTRCLLRLLVSF